MKTRSFQLKELYRKFLKNTIGPENYSLVPMIVLPQKFAFFKPFWYKFQKVFNTKVVRFGKTSPTEEESPKRK